MQGDILEDIALIENLEETKRTSVEIAAQVKAAKDTEVSPRLDPDQAARHPQLQHDCSIVVTAATSPGQHCISCYQAPCQASYTPHLRVILVLRDPASAA